MVQHGTAETLRCEEAESSRLENLAEVENRRCLTVLRMVEAAAPAYAASALAGGSWLAPSVQRCGWLPRAILRSWADLIADQRQLLEYCALEERVLQRKSIAAHTGGTRLALVQERLLKQHT